MLFFLVTGEAAPAQKPQQVKVDETLFERIGAGDMAAFEILYIQTERTVHAYVLSVVKNADDTVDIVQDTYLKIRAAAHLYKPMGKPMAWIFTIARNLAMSHLRQKSVKGASNWESHENDPAFSYISDSLDRLVLEAALKILKDDEREVVLLHAISGMKHHEIASSLNVPLSTALSRYHRALKKLKKHLQEQGVRQ